MLIGFSDTNALSFHTDFWNNDTRGKAVAASVLPLEDTWSDAEATRRDAVERTWAEGLKAPAAATQPKRRLSPVAVRLAVGIGAAACVVSAMRGANADGLLASVGASSYPYMGFDANGTSYGINTLLSPDTRDEQADGGKADALIKRIATCTNYTQVATRALNIVLGSAGSMPNAALLLASKLDPTDAVQNCIRSFVGFPIAH